MSINGRQKGASFERLLCKEIQEMIFQELGMAVDLRRNLEQYRSADLGDIQGMEDYGWTVEAKRYGKNQGGSYREEWWRQVTKASEANGSKPVLIFKYDRQPIRCAVRLSDINSDFVGKDDVCVVSFETWCMIVREGLCDE